MIKLKKELIFCGGIFVKRFLALFLVLLMTLSLFACGGGEAEVKECDECVDSDKDLKCDVCSKEIEINAVTYEEFGAVGDGKTDDYKAIYDAHVYANETGRPVKATDGKTYYLKDSKIKNSAKKLAITPIPIKTDVYWGTAEFIIDDTDIDYYKETEKAKANVFVVESDHEKLVWTKSDPAQAEKIEALGKIGYSYGTTKIDLGLDYPAMLIIYNKNHEVYKRSGSSYNGSGVAQHELIVVDKDGYISEDTPFMFDYEEITSIEIINLDVEPITIKGGTVTTRACRVDTLYKFGIMERKAGYLARGLEINRSFTTVDGLKHYMEGEVTLEEYKGGLEGAHYNGFYYAKQATDVTFKNCIMTGRRYYKVAGSYEFGADLVNNITLDGCNQCNFWVTKEDGKPSDTDTGRLSMESVDLGDGVRVQYCWGLGGTNFCKNMNYINSRLSRFDAHQGLYNGSIVNCEINFFEVIGKGTFTMKDTTWYSPGEGLTNNSLVYLRNDYGSTWEGDIIIDNVTAYVSDGAFQVFFHNYTDWDYGYKCYVPNIEIIDLELYSINTREKLDSSYSNLYMFTDRLSTGKAPYMHLEEIDSVKNNNPIVAPKYIKITSNKNGYKYKIPYDSNENSFFADVEFYSDGKEVKYQNGSAGAFNFVAK